MSIPINIENLLAAKFVEDERIEFKAGWNPKTVMRSICAFANDFFNQGSGYIVIGVEEENGKAKRPVKGISIDRFDSMQKELIGYCNLIQPAYAPHISLEKVDGKDVVAIWVPAGSVRPYKVPDDILAKHKKYNYRIRQYSSSVVPNPEQEKELIQLTAQIPFDDRVNTQAKIDDLDFGLLREHLSNIKSRLFDESSKMSIEELARAMNLCEGADEHLFPKNVALLMFSNRTQEYFPGVQIDIVHFPKGVDAKEFTEKIYTGPIQKQLVDALQYIKNNFIEEKVEKIAGQAEANRCYNYPFEAIEEALANAVYHRDYQLREPIEVRILPTSIEVVSYSGIDPSLKQKDFEDGRVLARRYRNRRIGDFLKELSLTEGRGTGIPAIYNAIAANKSPQPRFNTDDPDRRFFFVAFDAISKEALGVNRGGQIGGQVGGPMSGPIELTDRQNEIVRELLKNSRVTRKELSKKLSINESAIQKHLKTLRDKGAIKRIGGTRGYWEVVRN